MKRLQGRKTVITGAGSGIGRASALRFAREGASVLVVGRRSENTEETVRLVRAEGGVAVGQVSDAAAESDVRTHVERSGPELGGPVIFFGHTAPPSTRTATR